VRLVYTCACVCLLTVEPHSALMHWICVAVLDAFDVWFCTSFSMYALLYRSLPGFCLYRTMHSIDSCGHAVLAREPLCDCARASQLLIYCCVNSFVCACSCIDEHAHGSVPVQACIICPGSCQLHCCTTTCTVLPTHASICVHLAACRYVCLCTALMWTSVLTCAQWCMSLHVYWCLLVSNVRLCAC
jgi:hypothetical protein